MEQLQAYLLVCETDREQFVAILDQTNKVRNWLTFLPNAIAFVSAFDPYTLGQYIREKLPGKQFIFLPVFSSTTGGALPPHVWNFINNPTDSGKWQSANVLADPAGAFNRLKRGLPPANSFSSLLFPPRKDDDSN